MKMRLREITKMRYANNGSRTLFESAMMPELNAALRDWANAQTKSVLIGGLGLSYHIRPRMTQDLDFLFRNKADIPSQVPGFRRTRAHAFQHDETHVEVEIITPQHINVPPAVIDQVMQTATESNGIRVASAAGLVALKLFRLSMQDKADIIALIKSNRVADIGHFNLPPEKLRAFQELHDQAQSDPHPG